MPQDSKQFPPVISLHFLSFPDLSSFSFLSCSFSSSSNDSNHDAENKILKSQDSSQEHLLPQVSMVMIEDFLGERSQGQRHRNGGADTVFHVFLYLQDLGRSLVQPGFLSVWM